MKPAFSIAIILPVIFACTQVANLEAQETGSVAVLDVVRVFKENKELELQLKKINQDAESLKKEKAKLQRDIIKRFEAEFKKTEPGTDRWRQLEAELERRTTTLVTACKGRTPECDLMEREAMAYYKAYQEFKLVVAKVAEEHNISLVLRKNDRAIAQPDPKSPKDLERKILFSDKRIDLTPSVIAAMNQAASNMAKTRQKPQ